MEYLSNSVRKIGRLFSSPTPASTLGKRKASDDSDVDYVPSKRRVSFSFTEEEYAATEYAGSSRPFPDSPQESSPESAITQPRSKQTALTSRASTATEKANQAIRKARETMQTQGNKAATTPTVQVDETGIQDELERREIQEQANQTALLEQQKKATQASSKAQSTTEQASKLPGRAGQTGAKKKVHFKTHSKSARNVWFGKLDQWLWKWHEKHEDPASVILGKLKEPAYACRDIEIRDGIMKLMHQIEHFAKPFAFTVDDETTLRPIFEKLAPETVKIIGCVASGGPAGARGWEDFFRNSEKRQALICAIIGNVLVEQVFQHLFFGGTKDQIEQIARIQEDHSHEDGEYTRV